MILLEQCPHLVRKKSEEISQETLKEMSDILSVKSTTIWRVMNASGMNAISTYLVITFRGNEARTIGLRLCGTRKRSPIKVLGNADLSHDLFRCLNWLRGPVVGKSYIHCATSQRWSAIFFYEILNHSIRESRTIYYPFECVTCPVEDRIQVGQFRLHKPM